MLGPQNGASWFGIRIGGWLDVQASHRGHVLSAALARPEATEAGLAVRDPSTARLLRFAKQPLRSEFVTFSKLPKIDAANKAVTTTKSSKIQKSHKLSG